MSGYRFREETRVLDAQARADAPGQFVELPDGVVHYELAGPPEGPLVVLIHGFSVPYFVWDPTFDGLVKAGFRVLRYDLYGRGYSGRPEAVYGGDLFERQLDNLLDALAIARPVNVVGLSMGGAIAVVFASRHPEEIRRLALLAPAGLPQKQPLVARLVRLPVIGELVMDWFGSRVLVSGLKDDFHQPGGPPEGYAERYRQQLQYVGFKGSLLSTLRSGLLTGIRDAYAEVGRHEYPVLLVWGRWDRVVPFALNEEVRRLIPRAQFHIVENAGHAAHFERAEEVVEVLSGFLSGTG